MDTVPLAAAIQRLAVHVWVPRSASGVVDRDDLAQDVAVRFWRAAANVASLTAEQRETWLRTTARRLLLDRVRASRREKRNAKRTVRLGPDVQVSATAIALGQEPSGGDLVLSAVHAAQGCLTPVQQAVVRGVYVDGL